MARPNSYEPNRFMKDRMPGVSHADIKKLNEARLDAGQIGRKEIVKPETMTFADGRRATVAYDRQAQQWTAIIEVEGQRFTITAPSRRELVDTLMEARAENEADYQAANLPEENAALNDWLENYEGGRLYNGIRTHLSAYKVNQVWKLVLSQLERHGWSDCEFNPKQVERCFMDAWDDTMDGYIIDNRVNEVDTILVEQSNATARLAEDKRLRAQIARVTEPLPSANIPVRQDAFVGDEANAARSLSIQELRRIAVPAANPARKNRG